jgi:hypothetical protein
MISEPNYATDGLRSVEINLGTSFKTALRSIGSTTYGHANSTFPYIIPSRIRTVMIQIPEGAGEFMVADTFQKVSESTLLFKMKKLSDLKEYTARLQRPVVIKDPDLYPSH